jgi:hypothetical protein
MAKVKGGDKAAVKIAELGKKLSDANKVRVGFLENAKYADGTPVAMVAAIQEYGAPRARIPPRPFFRNMIADKKGEWPKAFANLLKANDYDARLTLEQGGAAIAGQLRQSIIDLLAPPLSPVTLMLRKMFGNHPEAIRGRDVAEARRRVAAGESTAGVSTKPLVWTGHLLASVDYEVKSA